MRRLLFLLFVCFRSRSIQGDLYETKRIIDSKQQELVDLLYLNETSINNENKNRKLVATIPCVKCLDLKYCSIINNRMIEERYFPMSSDTAATAKLGACKVLEDLGERIYGEIFGPSLPFRDSPTCRGNFTISL